MERLPRALRREIKYLMVDAKVVDKVEDWMLVDENDRAKIVWCVEGRGYPSVVYKTTDGYVKAMTVYLTFYDNLVEYFYADVEKELGVIVDSWRLDDIFVNEEVRARLSEVYPVLGAFIAMLERAVAEASRKWGVEIEFRINRPKAGVYLVGRTNVKGLNEDEESEKVRRLLRALIDAYTRGILWLRDEAPKIFEETLEDAKRAMLDYGRRLRSEG